MNKTYIFRDYDPDKNEFTPLQTIVSDDFGRHFFIDVAFELISAPSYRDSDGYDKDAMEYVNGFWDFQDGDFSKLLEIHRTLCWTQWQEDRDKAHSEMCEYMDAVENGEIQFL
tara:strand:- start:121 stop:459 length:339 start_codon:yes stop_codon:yes gene_type:complete